METANLACMSGYATRINNDVGYCADAPRTRNLAMPVACSADTDCLSMNGFDSTSCTCGFNMNA